MGLECLPGNVFLRYDDRFLEKTGNLSSQDMEKTIHELAQMMRKVVLNKESIDIKELSGLLKSETDSIIKDLIKKALEQTGNNRLEVARLLNVSPRVLRYLLHEKE